MTRRILIVLFAAALPVFAQLSRAGDPPCPALDLTPWTGLLVSEQYEEAQNLAHRWTHAPACVCKDEADACLSIAVGGMVRTVSQTQLNRAASDMIQWKKSMRASCDALGGGSIGVEAQGACIDRAAERMTGVEDETSRFLLRPTVEIVAKNARGKAREPALSKGGEEPMISPSVHSLIEERARERTAELVRELCDLRTRKMESEERLERILRQPVKYAPGKQEFLHREQETLKKIGADILRAETSFKEYAGREFVPATDCRNIPKPPSR